MRVTLIHNPVAGDDGEPDADELTGIIRAAGYDIAYRSAKDDDWSASLEDPGAWPWMMADPTCAGIRCKRASDQHT
jgi:hypothetical protein